MKVICNKRTEACITDHGCYHAEPHVATEVMFSDYPEDDGLCDRGEGFCQFAYEIVRCIPWED